MDIKDAASFGAGYVPVLSTLKLIKDLNLKESYFRYPADYKLCKGSIGALSLLEDACSVALIATGPIGLGMYVLNKTIKNAVGESVTGRLDPIAEYTVKTNSFLRESFSAMKKLSKER